MTIEYSAELANTKATGGKKTQKFVTLTYLISNSQISIQKYLHYVLLEWYGLN